MLSLKWYDQVNSICQMTWHSCNFYTLYVCYYHLKETWYLWIGIWFISLSISISSCISFGPWSKILDKYWTLMCEAYSLYRGLLFWSTWFITEQSLRCRVQIHLYALNMIFKSNEMWDASALRIGIHNKRAIQYATKDGGTNKLAIKVLFLFLCLKHHSIQSFWHKS